MADNVLTIRIEGSADGAKAALTNTNEQVVKLKFSLDEAGNAGKRAGNGIRDGAEAANYSMLEARHGIMLTAEGLGVHIPRAAASMIASIAPVGALFAATLPIIAVAAVAAAIYKVVEANEKQAEALRKVAEASENTQIKEHDRTEGLELQNLRLEDQIHKIEGEPSTNRLQEALIEAHTAADQLVASLSEVTQKSQEALISENTFGAQVKDTLRVIWEGFKNGVLDDTSQKMANVQTNIEGVGMAMGNVEKSRLKLAEAKTEDEQIAALKELQENYQLLHDRAENTSELLKTAPGDWSKALGAVTQAAIIGANGVKDMGSQMDILNNKIKLAGDEDAEEAGKRADQVFKQQADEAKRQADFEEKVWDDHYKEVVANLQQSEKEKLEATKEGTAQRLSVIDAALQEEDARGLQDTGFYKALQLERIKTVQQMADTETKIKEDALRRQQSLDEQAAQIQKQLAGVLIEQDIKQGNFAKALDDTSAAYKREAQSLQEIIDKNTALAHAPGADYQTQKTALDSANTAQLKLNAATEQYQQQLARIKAESPWAKIQDDLQKQSSTITLQTGLYQNMATQLNSGVGNALRGWIVDGKNVGVAFENMFANMLASQAQFVIEWLLKKAEMWALSKILDQTGQAATGPPQVLAAAAIGTANAIASFAAAPWPIDTGAPAFGAAIGSEIAALAPLAAYDEGGMSPGGLSLLHPREAVLNPTQTANFQKMAEGGGGGHTITFAPQVNVGGNFDANTHFPQIWNAFQGKLKTMGVKL